MLLSVITLVFLASVAGAADPEWRLRKEDDFNRIGLGTDWLVLRGEWHINKDKQLDIQRQWPSHSVIAHTMNLRGKNVKVEMDLQVPSRMLGYVYKHHGRKRLMSGTGFGFNLQSGALDWAGGGIDDRAGIELNARRCADIGGAQGVGREEGSAGQRGSAECDSSQWGQGRVHRGPARSHYAGRSGSASGSA
jgi:hypothetical protein